MLSRLGRWLLFALAFASFVLLYHRRKGVDLNAGLLPDDNVEYGRGRSDVESILDGEEWSMHQHFPVNEHEITRLPSAAAKTLPEIQYHAFRDATKGHQHDLSDLEQKRRTIKQAFMHSWHSYRAQAWGHDELRPVTGGFRDPFCGWAATLVDSLDTLWLMDEKAEFDVAIETIKDIDFKTAKRPDIPIFEATIRYLGGLLGAYDISEGTYTVLLQKAIEIGDVLMGSFDTPNHMPMTYYEWQPSSTSKPRRARSTAVLSELGSLTIEFTRLAQLTGNHSYYDAIDRVTKALIKLQTKTSLPGMWPVYLDASGCKKDEDRNSCFSQDHLVPASSTLNDTYTLAGKSDSVYEYLPKQHLLLGQTVPHYERMYKSAMTAVHQNLLFRPLTPTNADILVSGSLAIRKNDSERTFLPYQAHLTCYVGAQFALGAKIFNIPTDLQIAEKLTDGCVWAYEATPSGIMPEDFFMLPTTSEHEEWSEPRWQDAVREEYRHHSDRSDTRIPRSLLPRGIIGIKRPMYILRPEAIESIFYMYRITGDAKWRDQGWKMFQSIDKGTKTVWGHSGIESVLVGAGKTKKMDVMQSFWLAETLKYFWLLFSDESLMSLDEFVLNTEAHPFRLPRPP